MIPLRGGEFLMGSDTHYPEERPAHHVQVDSFLIDATPVTNRKFRQFVADTGYVTLAEKLSPTADIPDPTSGLRNAGSMVFSPPRGPVDLRFASQWWEFREGANWRHPHGPGSGLFIREDHPVVHIAFEDALAYARWAGKDLPTEAEWEYAARGGLHEAEFAWGNELAPGGRHMANTWQGEFPHENLREDGYERTSPVTAFAPNGYGIYDMIGNVWEWTCDWFSPQHAIDMAARNVGRLNPRGGDQAASCDPREPDLKAPRKVLKGGSHLSAPNHCRRYRPAARRAQAVGESSSHVGFRCVVRDPKQMS